MRNLEDKLDTLIADKTVENIFVRVGRGDEVLYDAHRGGVNENTLFDMASLTKIYVTTMLTLIAIDKGLLSVDQPVKDFYPDTERDFKIFNLLTHTIGIGYKSIRQEGCTYENIAEKILEIPLDIPVAEDVLYSCPAFILLGKIVEKIFGKRLDEGFQEYIAQPLGLGSTGFCPTRRTNVVNANDQEELIGTVNDYNCRFLGGISGNAGLFSDVVDTTKYVRCLIGQGAPLISKETFQKAVQNYTPDKSESRGLGFVYVDGRCEHTGSLFSDGAIGHYGHTGQSVFLDYRTGLYVIILSDANAVTTRKYGEERYSEVIRMRQQLHNAIRNDLNEMQER